MSGGVSKAILAAAGRSIEEEARKVVPLRVGDVAVTSAGSLPAQHILHAATLDRELNIRPSERTIRLAAENVFRRCEFLGVRRLAMPALGTGSAGFAPDLSAKLIVRALAKHTASPTALREVVFSLPDPQARTSFSEFLQDALSLGVVGAARGAPRSGDDDDEDDTGAQIVADSAAPGAFRPPPTSSSSSVEPSYVSRVTRWFRRGEGSPQRSSPHSTASANSSTVTAPHPRVPDANRDPHRLLSSATTARPLLSNRYVLLEELGRGGMGIVYLAWDIVFRQVIAIKTLRPEERVVHERAAALKREAALQIGLAHEGIVRLMNFEPWDETVGPYIIMEYLPWASGDRWIAEAGLSGLPLHSVLAVGSRLCEALAYAHSANVLHGDIKPSNVFVDPTGERAKLADFGIARVIGARDRNALVTRLVGTPDYMAPEQKAFGAKVGPWTDIYLLSRTLVEFLGGRARPEGIDLPPQVALEPVVSALSRGVARQPTDRPADAYEFGRLLGIAQSALG